MESDRNTLDVPQLLLEDVTVMFPNMSRIANKCPNQSQNTPKCPALCFCPFMYYVYDSLVGTKCISSPCTTVQDRMSHCVLNSTYCNSYCLSCPHVPQDMMVQHSTSHYVPNLYNGGTNCPSCPHVPQDRMVVHPTEHLTCTMSHSEYKMTPHHA